MEILITDRTDDGESHITFTATEAHHSQSHLIYDLLSKVEGQGNISRYGWNSVQGQGEYSIKKGKQSVMQKGSRIAYEVSSGFNDGGEHAGWNAQRGGVREESPVEKVLGGITLLIVFVLMALTMVQTQEDTAKVKGEEAIADSVHASTPSKASYQGIQARQHTGTGI